MDTKLTFLQDIHPRSSKNEVKNNIAIPLLNTLGYEFYDWEAKTNIFSSKPDFIIHSFDPQRPYLIVECKRAQSNISDANDGSIIKHIKRQNPTLALVTNGQRFQVYFNDQNNVISKIIDYNQFDVENFFDLLNALLGRNTLFRVNKELEAGRQLAYNKFFSDVWEKYSPIKQTKDSIISHQKDNKLFKAVTPVEQKKKNPKRKAKVITIFNNKGGVGKTTMTINLGAALNRLGNKVLLVDIDAQANLTTGLGIDPYEDLELSNHKDISDLLVDPQVKPDDNLIITKQWNNTVLNLIPSHIKLAEEKDSQIVKQLNYDSLLKRKLKPCLDDYDYILIDPPPSFGVANRMALMACDALLIPTQFAPYSIRALEYVVKRVIAVQEAKGEDLHILGMAVSMFFQDAQKVTLDSIRQVNKLLTQIKSNTSGITELPKGNLSLLPENTWIPHYDIVASSTSDEYACPVNELNDSRAQEVFAIFSNLASYVEDYFERLDKNINTQTYSNSQETTSLKAI